MGPANRYAGIVNATECKHYEQELDSTNQQLNALASTDALTGIWNRYQLQMAIRDLLARTASTGGASAMMLCDIDHFKAINDSHGHDVGDRVLVEFSERMQACLRSSNRLGRWGGEEFMILMSPSTASGAGVLAEKVRAAIADQPFEPVGRVTASFVVAQHRPNEPLLTWFQRVDSLLYAAKAAGRDQVMVEQG